MKKLLCTSLLLSALLLPTVKASADIDSTKTDEESLWTGGGAQDATYSAVSISMVGWGLGMAGGIALLASAIHQSSSSSHDSSSCSH